MSFRIQNVCYFGIFRSLLGRNHQISRTKFCQPALLSPKGGAYSQNLWIGRLIETNSKGLVRGRARSPLTLKLFRDQRELFLALGRLTT